MGWQAKPKHVDRELMEFYLKNKFSCNCRPLFLNAKNYFCWELAFESMTVQTKMWPNFPPTGLCAILFQVPLMWSILFLFSQTPGTYEYLPAEYSFCLIFSANEFQMKAQMPSCLETNGATLFSRILNMNLSDRSNIFCLLKASTTTNRYCVTEIHLMTKSRWRGLLCV